MTVFTLDEQNELVEASLRDVSDAITSLGDAVATDLDKVFLPSNILVSPLNPTDRFLQEDYLLTEHQENIKKAVLAYVETNTQGRFAGITGGPGTGKTLLIYINNSEHGSKAVYIIIINFKHNWVYYENFAFLLNKPIK